MEIALGGSKENLLKVFKELTDLLEADKGAGQVEIPSNGYGPTLTLEFEVFTLADEAEVLYEVSGNV